jgi:hypothetical protein
MTAGHLATTPRMVKVADALAEADYDVSVVSTQFIEWADQADRAIISSRWSRWRWTTVDYRKRGARARATLTALRMRAVKQFTRARGLEKISIGTAARIRERVFPELVAAAVSTRPSLIYGGGSALAATAAAAKRANVPFALDLEDFHSAQDPDGRYSGITEKIEREVLPQASLLTAGSTAIADAYHSAYGLDVVPIHNVFPLPSIAPTPREWDGTLRLYWFGQTIGAGRGLEETIRAAGRSGVPTELTIRGNPRQDFIRDLNTLAAEAAPQLTLTLTGPASPDDMVDLCRPYDVGIAVENPEGHNQALALSNKSLTYILAGLAVAINDTPGQHEFAVDLGEGALIIPGRDIDVVARGLKRWSDDPESLHRAKLASWDAAVRRWNWDNPEECRRMVDAVGAVLKG